jgi:hypothetical protein
VGGAADFAFEDDVEAGELAEAGAVGYVADAQAGVAEQESGAGHADALDVGEGAEVQCRCEAALEGLVGQKDFDYFVNRFFAVDRMLRAMGMIEVIP